MPAIAALLTDDQTTLIQAALAQHGANAACPACGDLAAQAIGDSVVNLPLSHASDRLTFAEQLPCAYVVCSNCGNIRLHALGTLGLLGPLSAAPLPAVIALPTQPGPDDAAEPPAVEPEPAPAAAE
jgi:hypothetical protein